MLELIVACRARRFLPSKWGLNASLSCASWRRSASRSTRLEPVPIPRRPDAPRRTIPGIAACTAPMVNSHAWRIRGQSTIYPLLLKKDKNREKAFGDSCGGARDQSALDRRGVESVRRRRHSQPPRQPVRETGKTITAGCASAFRSVCAPAVRSTAGRLTICAPTRGVRPDGGGHARTGGIGRHRTARGPAPRGGR